MERARERRSDTSGRNQFYYLDSDEKRRARMCRIAQRFFRGTDQHLVIGMGYVRSGAVVRRDLLVLPVNVAELSDDTCHRIIRTMGEKNRPRFLPVVPGGRADGPTYLKAHELAREVGSVLVNLKASDKAIAGLIRRHLRKLQAVEELA